MFLVTNSEQKKGFSNFADREKLMKISRSEFSNKEKNDRETYPVGSWISSHASQHFGGSNRCPRGYSGGWLPGWLQTVILRLRKTNSGNIDIAACIGQRYSSQAT
jgi:hypothetical protein